PNAYVHHKFAPSDIRGDNRVTRHYYPIIKNKIYFTLKHAQQFLGYDEIEQDNNDFSDQLERSLNLNIVAGRLNVSEREKFKKDRQRATEDGLERGKKYIYEMINEEKLQRYGGNFLKFSPIPALQDSNTPANSTHRVIVLISMDFPPEHVGGIAVFSKDLAESLAKQGNIVHVITKDPVLNRVDFENGVWVHRLLVDKVAKTAAAKSNNIPQHIWDWSATALKEVKRIATHRTIDVVEAPIWDCEGIAFLLDKQWPLVTSLHTTLHFWLDAYPQRTGDTKHMQKFVQPMLLLEKQLMTQADAVRANSVAIKQDIAVAYEFEFNPQTTLVIPHGLANPSIALTEKKSQQQKPLTILFVGRLEYRKGIDVLLAVIPLILQNQQPPKVIFRIIGDDSLKKTDETITYKNRYLKTEAAKENAAYVHFEGRVDEAILQQAYADCDIFVAPSRYESFGLVLLEAMRYTKPLIACSAGGMPEIITPEQDGLLIKAGDQEQLLQALNRLIESAELRNTLGNHARQSFDQKFTAQRMAQASAELYQIAENTYSKP
ncbi:MAG: hypothetical protein DRQ62_13610, partial [Gammaproteobacteria bacterium]